MRIVLQYGEWVVVELDKPFCFAPKETREASYVAFNVNADQKLLKENLFELPQVMWRRSILGFPRYYHQVNIEQKDFPENVLQILKILRVLNEDGTVNSKYEEYKE